MANKRSEFAQKKRGQGSRPQAESGLSREVRVLAAGGVPLETM